THVREVTGHLQLMGHDVSLISYNCSRNSITAPQGPSFLHLCTKRVVPKWLKRLMRYVDNSRKTHALMERFRPQMDNSDVIYERDTLSDFAIASYCKRNAKPWVLECNGLFWNRTEAEMFHVPF